LTVGVHLAAWTEPILPVEPDGGWAEIAMAKVMSAASARGHAAVHTLFAAGGPLLVEVRFPGAIYSSDWYLLDNEHEFDEQIERLDAGAVLHVNRVWDLTNRAGAVCLRR